MWKLNTFTFVVFTNTFSHVPNIYNVRLGYNDAPSNTIKVHVQYPLQCYDKTKNYGRYPKTNDDEYQKLIVGMRQATFDVSNHSTTSSSKAKYNPPSLLMYLRSLISSIFWSKKCLLFLMIFMHASIFVCKSCAWIALFERQQNPGI